jgi:predicted membrane protein
MIVAFHNTAYHNNVIFTALIIIIVLISRSCYKSIKLQVESAQNCVMSKKVEAVVKESFMKFWFPTFRTLYAPYYYTRDNKLGGRRL